MSRNLVIDRDDTSHRPLAQRIQGAVMAASLVIGFGLGIAAIETPDGLKRLAEKARPLYETLATHKLRG